MDFFLIRMTFHEMAADGFGCEQRNIKLNILYL